MPKENILDLHMLKLHMHFTAIDSTNRHIQELYDHKSSMIDVLIIQTITVHNFPTCFATITRWKSGPSHYNNTCDYNQANLSSPGGTLLANTVHVRCTRGHAKGIALGRESETSCYGTTQGVESKNLR